MLHTHTSVLLLERQGKERHTLSCLKPLKKFSRALTQVYGVKMSIIPYNPSISFLHSQPEEGDIQDNR
jgi:hypothetical protein